MFDIKENLKKLPDTPGVYLHKDKLGQVIYVGKAVSLRNRVRQYFQSGARSNPKVAALVSHIAEFEYITCSTEMEALILECNLIKKYMPRYNVLLRDDKTYPYIMVTTSEAFPRVVKTRRIARDGNKYFGPYSDAGAVNQIVSLLSSIYCLKQCSATTFPAQHRPCLNYHIRQCRGVCTGTVDPAAYAAAIDQVLSFLGGHEKPLLRHLTEKMQEASDRMDFEEAARCRDAIASVQSISETQRVTMTQDQDLDVVLPVKDEAQTSIVLFTVRDGKLSGRETFPIQAAEGDSAAEMTAAFIKQYYSQWAAVPPEILVEEQVPEHTLLEAFLRRDGRRVRIFVPQKGAKRALLTMAQHDRQEMAKTLSQKAKLDREKQSAVRAQVAMVIREAGAEPGDAAVFRVESYDISNTNGVDSVGAMVVFNGLQRNRKEYRRFKIRTVEGSDDYGSLQEMLYRRFRRAQAGDPAFVHLPDVIFMDGGQGQVTAARKVLDAMKLDIPVVGMAKDDSHRTRALVFADGREIALADHPILFRYCGTIQEEVHRFAIDYHRNLRSKHAFHSALDEIPGIGPKRRNALLRHFGSVDAIRTATLEQLLAVPEMTERAAQAVKKYFG